MVLELTSHRGDVQANTTRVGFFLILATLRGQNLMWMVFISISSHQLLSGLDIRRNMKESSVDGKPQEVREFSYTPSTRILVGRDRIKAGGGPAGSEGRKENNLERAWNWLLDI